VQGIKKKMRMVNTHSQIACQQQKPYDETYQERQTSHRSYISSREISRRGRL